MDKFNKREEDAFCFVYEHFYNELYYFASKLFLDNTVLPYDVLQDIFLNVLENKKQFESFDLLKSYLYLSIRNRWKNEHKHTVAAQRYTAQSFDEKRRQYPVKYFRVRNISHFIQSPETSSPGMCQSHETFFRRT